MSRLFFFSSFFFFNDTATTEIYTLSLHDALPISARSALRGPPLRRSVRGTTPVAESRCSATRSEEHTSELQSHLNLVCRLLLEKKKNKHTLHHLYDLRHTSYSQACNTTCAYAVIV